MSFKSSLPTVFLITVQVATTEVDSAITRRDRHGIFRSLYHMSVTIYCHEQTASNFILSQSFISASLADSQTCTYKLKKVFLFTEDLWEQAASRPCPLIPLDQATLARRMDHLSVLRLKLLFQKKSRFCKILEFVCLLFVDMIIVYFLVFFACAQRFG